MRVKWLGHSSFLITSKEGVRIITDPYGTAYPELTYEPIEESADVVLVSHEHLDHVGAKVKGNPTAIRRAGIKKVKGMEFKGLASFHDDAKGRQRGANTIFCFSVDGVKICHLGDLGHQLTEQQVAEMGAIDILMIPVGGFFTIDPAGATQVYERIKPRVVIPMHFKNKKCALPIVGVEEFLKGKKNVKRMNTSEAEFKQGELPSATEIVVFQPAL